MAEEPSFTTACNSPSRHSTHSSHASRTWHAPSWRLARGGCSAATQASIASQTIDERTSRFMTSPCVGE